MIEKYVGGRSCAILGLGVSNLPLARLLTEKNVRLKIYDKCSASELGSAAEELQAKGVEFFVTDRELDGIDGEVIFRSPGIRPDRRGLVAARQRGAEITSEMELFLKLTPAKTYAVTGSDGKTTTTTLVGKFLTEHCQRKGNARTYVGGNIGVPLLTECQEMSSEDNAVLELSSFQLMTLADAPERAAITNVSENHLDWHTDMKEYVDAKMRVIGERTRRFVTNAECPATVDIAKQVRERDVQIILFSSKKDTYSGVLGELSKRPRTLAVYLKDGYITVDDGEQAKRALCVDDIKIPGKHNVENFMTAIALTWGDIPVEIYSDVARNFFGVEHRLELVRTLDGVEYYNSSIDSSPTRTAAALSALVGRGLVLICGGYDKNLDYAPLAEAICEHGGVHSVVLTGATGEKIAAEMRLFIERTGKGADIRIERRAVFADAVALARECANEGDAVVLSPASASFDAFKNFMERGNTFKHIVNEF